MASYRYEAPLEDSALHVHFRDDQGRAVGAMRVEQREDGAMMAALGDVRLVTRGQRQGPTRLAVHYALAVGDAPVLQIRALLEDLSCGAVSEPRSLGCAPGVSLDPEDGLVVPSCGLDYDGRLADRQLPTVTALSYGVTSPASGPPELVRARSFDAIDEGVPAEETDRMAWLAEAGVLDALRSSDARRLLAAYPDPAWRRVLGDHVAACITDGAFTFSDPADDGVAARREPLTSGTNGNRNEDAWGGSGDRRGASSKGDPHLVTFDGRAYDMQSQAELVLARSTGGAADPLEVQARFEPRSGGRDVPLCRSVSLTTAVAARFGDHVIEVRPDATLVDGVPLDPGDVPSVAGPDRQILRSDGTIILVWADGTELEVGRGAGTVRIDMYAEPGRAGQLEGLFGDADGDPNDDLVVRGSGPLPRPASFEEIHRGLRSSWVVSADTSLFTYAEGEGPDDFDVPSFPEIPADPALIPPAERGQLEDTCRSRGARGVALIDCVLDLYCLRDPQLADDVRKNRPLVQERPSGVSLRGDIVEGGYGETLDVQASVDPDGCTAFPPTVAVIRPEPPVVLDTALPVDARGPGAVTPSPGMVAAARSVRSYLLSFPGAASPSRLEGAVRFSGEILGIQRDDVSLEAGDVLLPEGVTAEADGRGLTETEGLVVSDDLRTLTFDRPSSTDGAGAIRVIVAREES